MGVHTAMAKRVADAFLLRDPAKALKGETVEVSKLGEYERALKSLQKEYKAQQLKQSQLPAGRAKGMAGRDLQKIHAKGRLARIRVEVARSLKRRGLTKIRLKV